MVILSAFVPVFHVHTVPDRDQKKVSAPLELGLQMVVSLQVRVGSLKWILFKSSKCLNYLTTELTLKI